jgi:histidyl-tRNA synthetase
MEKPTLPKGTRDFGPVVMAKRQFILGIIRSVFQKYGFQPLETPAMESLETLTGKYGDEGDQLLFKVLNNGDFLKEVEKQNLVTRNSKLVTPYISSKGLRYDLTVPFARYVVMNRHEITFPFRRYQVQPVWRADRPQKGRYREFYQCDADVVGTDSLICEAEIVLMIQEAFRGLGLNDYSIKINHRGILSGIAEQANAKEKESSLFVAIDKLDKIGEEGVRKELTERDFSNESIAQVFEILNHKGNNKEKVTFLSNQLKNSEIGSKGVSDMGELFNLLNRFESDQRNIDFDISLARGLSYYTGTIFEVKINNVSMGSVSGGGRYDDLTQVFGSKERLSGVGISFGVDRLYDAMEEMKLFPESTLISTTVIIAHLDDACKIYGLKVLQALRDKNISSEIYPDTSKIKKQLDYANKKKIPFVIVIGPDEMKTGDLTLKNMISGEQSSLTIDQITKQLIA